MKIKTLSDFFLSNSGQETRNNKQEPDNRGTERRQSSVTLQCHWLSRSQLYVG